MSLPLLPLLSSLPLFEKSHLYINLEAYLLSLGLLPALCFFCLWFGAMPSDNPDSLLEVYRSPYQMPNIEPELTSYKTNTLPVVLWIGIQPAPYFEVVPSNAWRVIKI